MPLRSGCLQKALGLAVCLVLWVPFGQAQAQALAPVAADALPTGGQVVSGVGRISQNGAAMVIEQQSQKMITNWQQFNVGKDASVTFQQPNSAAVSLNRVRSMDPSQIHGRIQANGKVFLINPNGVVFGPNAVVDAGGLLASTRDIADQDFLDGVMRFSGDSAGKVDQQGQIRTPDGGFVVLIGQQVRQSGTVSGGKGAHLGLVSANRVQVNVAGNELVGYRVEQGAVSALVENTGTISADGGTIVLSAHAFDALTTSVVNQAGVVKANGLSGDGGRVVLQGDRVTLASGSITTATGVKNGGSVDIISDHVDIQGVVDVSGQAQGGRAWVWAEQTARLNQASVRAESSQGAAGQIDVQAPVIELENTNVSASGETNGGMITLLAQTEAPSTALVAHLESRPASQMGLLDPAHPLNNPTSPPSEPTRLAILGSSVLSSNGRRGAGGGLVLTGDEISLLDTSQLISTGATGGGFVLVGGDWQGGANEQRRLFNDSDAVYEATKVTMAQGVLIDASATDHGDGGTVVLWSDISLADSVTTASGAIYAKGGAQSGNGGQIETSGAHLDTNEISVNAGALSGNSGLWLIDPYDYIINSTAASNIVTALN
ncbi:MAG: filamentous hemagglutinin N-terminal domain-containing protein, partial [Burkholderiaceae bacterium]